MATTPSFYVSWGLVTIPVKSYPAARDERVEFKIVHGPCAQEEKAADTKLERRCLGCTQLVPKAEEMKANEVEEGRYVLVTDEELKGLTAEKTKTMEIRRFVPLAGIDPIYLGRSNFLGPADPAAIKGFQLLRLAMRQKGKEYAAVVQYVESSREKVGIIRATDEALVLHEAFYPDEIRSFAEQSRIAMKDVPLSKEEMALAKELLEASAGPFSLDGLSDTYQKRVRELIEARRAGLPAPKIEAKVVAAPAVDLMAALKESLNAARKGKDGAEKKAKATATA
jgi:DNA end-binding protein Ku